MAVRVRIYTARLAAEFRRGGTIGQLAQRDSASIIRIADRKAPKGHSGRGDRIVGQHRRRVVPSSATLSTAYFVENTSGHAWFVHEGTTGPIVPLDTTPRRDRNGRLYRPRLKLQLGPGRVAFARSVRGQAKKPWLANAAAQHLGAKYGVTAGLRTYGS